MRGFRPNRNGRPSYAACSVMRMTMRRRHDGPGLKRQPLFQVRRYRSIHSQACVGEFKENEYGPQEHDMSLV